MVFFLSLAGSPAFLHASPLDTALKESRTRRLAEDPGWRRLLHYHKDLFGKEKSDIDGPNFFLAKKGRTNAQAELDATLTAFFNPPAVTGDEELPQCRFPARASWLKEKLGEAAAWAPVSCDRFDSWRSKLDPSDVSIIFASYYMNNPASLYGHTFLKLRNKTTGADNPLLDYTINFSANVPSNNGLIFAIKGLAGGYRGVFSTEPYYMKIQKYNNVESRDLWEYHLALSSAALDRLVEHVWEMGHTSIAYYFLNRNCSYQLLPLLEAVDPTRNLSEPFRFRAIPLDTLRAALNSSGLVSSVDFRPSHLRKMLASREGLSGPEKVLVQELVLHSSATLEAQVTQLPTDRQTRVLDAAYNYLHFKKGFWREQPGHVAAAEERILLLRNKLPASRPVALTGEAERPEIAHGTGRLFVSYGATRDTTFEEFEARGALHDLEADPAGFVPGSELESALLRFRFDNETGHGYVEEGTLIRVKSLAPLEEWVKKPSWHIEIGYARARDLGHSAERSGMGRAAGGTGLTLKIPYFKDSFLYGMVEGDSAVGGVFEDDYRLGLGGSGGILLTVIPQWRAHFLASWMRYGLGDDSSANRLKLVNAFRLSKVWEARVNLERQNHYQEGKVSLNLYF